jgi:hypothetical protein
LKATPPGPSRLFGFAAERRVRFPADELPLDILALLVSCGHAVRAEDAQALEEAVRSDGTHDPAVTPRSQRTVAEADEQCSALVVECESDSSPRSR